LVREDYRFVHRKRAKEWYDVAVLNQLVPWKG
jgi:hypothetical protein